MEDSSQSSQHGMSLLLHRRKITADAIDVAQIARDIRQVQALPGDAPTMLISVTRQSIKHLQSTGQRSAQG
jgi:hypothetical protein